MQNDSNDWIDVGAAAELALKPLQQVLLGRKKVALACKDGQFSAVSGVCNHAGAHGFGEHLARGGRVDLVVVGHPGAQREFADLQAAAAETSILHGESRVECE